MPKLKAFIGSTILLASSSSLALASPACNLHWPAFTSKFAQAEGHPTDSTDGRLRPNDSQILEPNDSLGHSPRFKEKPRESPLHLMLARGTRTQAIPLSSVCRSRKAPQGACGGRGLNTMEPELARKERQIQLINGGLVGEGPMEVHNLVLYAI